MTANHRNVVWCPRRRSPHAVAWVEIEDGAPVVVYLGIAPGREHSSSGLARLTVEQVRGDDLEDPFEGMTVQATCACGKRWDVDLVAVLDGKPQTLTRDTSTFPGVSWDRARG